MSAYPNIQPQDVPVMSNAELQKAIDSLLTYFTSEQVCREDLDEFAEGLALKSLLDEQTLRGRMWREPEPLMQPPPKP